MIFRKRRNQELITDPDVRLAICELALTLLADVEGLTPVPSVIDRMIYYAAMIGTLNGNPLNVSKIATDVGVSRATARGHLASLVRGGILLKLSDGTYVVKAEFANSEGVLLRTRRLQRAVEKAHSAMSQAEPDGGIRHQVASPSKSS